MLPVVDMLPALQDIGKSGMLHCCKHRSTAMASAVQKAGLLPSTVWLYTRSSRTSMPALCRALISCLSSFRAPAGPLPAEANLIKHVDPLICIYLRMCASSTSSIQMADSQPLYLHILAVVWHLHWQMLLLTLRLELNLHHCGTQAQHACATDLDMGARKEMWE